jgi:class 3 adenylate cyclase/predicted transcriptional regulator
MSGNKEVRVAEIDVTPAEGLDRKLATILSADVAEYSRLMAEDEEQTLRTFRGHKQVFEKLVALHRGRVFNTAGDAILAEFGSAVEAVRCATEIQAALRTRNDQLPEHRQVRFRIGVNLGDVMLQGEDLLGDGVNVAARLQSAAEPGGICVSGSVYDQIRNKLSLSFKPLGDMSFKNIPQAVRTFAIAEAEGLGMLPSPVTAPRRRRGGLLKWVAAAVALLLVAGGAAVWTYLDQHRSKVEFAREGRLAAEKLIAEEARQQAEAERLAAQTARERADRERQQAEEEMRRLAETERKETTTAALVPSKPVEAPPTPVRPPSADERDGVYGGQICYGPGPAVPARCFRAQAIVQKGRITGQWVGRDPNVTMYLAGDVTPAGDVRIHMHGQRSDGSRLAVMDLAGTLQDGRIDAKGSFLNGRSVTLDWRKN